MTSAVAVEPGEAGVALSSVRTNAVFGTVALGMLLAALDQTIVSTALPTIVGDLGGAGHLSWVVTSYLLAETIITAVAGKLGDLFGRKLVFQASVVIFLVASFFCGFANSMIWLIVWRAVQGLGAGGIMVTATALIADVIPLRDRGKYQGALGSVFGVVTVIGPLTGGLFVDHLSWRWAFYVNIPFGILVLFAAAATMPSIRSAARPIIDYAGIGLIAMGAGGLTLVTSWGGTTYPWLSSTIIATAAASVVGLVLFVLVELRLERRAAAASAGHGRVAEPMLPMRLFRSSVFSVCGALSFIVGFAMLGVMTYLPTFLQYVEGVSATMSGIRTLPLIVGLLLASVFSGNYVGKTGRYRIFPIAGSAVMSVGLFLLSLMDERTSVLAASLYMFVLGAGIGLCMQVLTIVVQNIVDYRDLGVATSGVTFLRTLGSSFGVAIFGTIYANLLDGKLRSALAATPLPAGVDPRVINSPAGVHALPAAVRASLIHAYAQSLHTVFLAAVPIGLLGLVLALFLRQVPLRDSARAVATDVGGGFAMPEGSDEVARLEQEIAALWRKNRGAAAAEVLVRAGSPLDDAGAWCLTQVVLMRRHRGEARPETIARDHRLPASVLEPAFMKMVDGGYLSRHDGVLAVTPKGTAEYDRLAAAWRDWLAERLDCWQPTEPAQQEQLDSALHRIARRLVTEEYVAPRT